MPNYLPNAEPFHFPGNSVGCLLIHGFTGTPYEMRELGQHLAAQGYTVLGPVLAGHATILDDLLPTRWHDWYNSVVTAYHELRQQCDTVFAIGLSLGALLALHLAAHESLNGVVAVSAPYNIQNPLIPLFKLFPFLHHLIPAVNKKLQDNDTFDPTVSANHPEYPAHPTRGAASLIFDFLPHLRAELGNIHTPALLIQSRGDRSIALNSLDEFFARIGSADKTKLWLERSGHLVLEDYSKEIAFGNILRFVQLHIPNPIPSKSEAR